MTDDHEPEVVHLLRTVLGAEPFAALIAAGRLRVLLQQLETDVLDRAVGDGLSYAAAARALGVTRQNVVQQLQRRTNHRRPRAALRERRRLERAIRDREWIEETLAGLPNDEWRRHFLRSEGYDTWPPAGLPERSPNS